MGLRWSGQTPISLCCYLARAPGSLLRAGISVKLRVDVLVLNEDGHPGQSLVLGAGLLFRCRNTLSHSQGVHQVWGIVATAGCNQTLLVAVKSDVRWRWAFSQEGACLLVLCSGPYLGGLWCKIRQWPRFPGWAYHAHSNFVSLRWHNF